MWAVFETTSRHDRLSEPVRARAAAEYARIIDAHGGILRSTQFVALVTAQRRVTKTVALVLLVVSALVATVASARTTLLGRSWQGRPIRLVEVGNPAAPRVLVFGGVHGNETAGIAVARALERLSPADLDLWIVPDLNPDGVAAGTRQNAHGVDLNRNFPWHWRPLSGRLCVRAATAVGAGGTDRADLDPARASARDDLVPPAPRPGLGVGRRSPDREGLRARAGLPYHPMPQLAGSAISWQNNTLPGTTAFAAELPAGPPSAAQVARYARAVLAAGRAR